MYSRETVKKTNEAFWTAYGKYMRGVPFAEAERQHWMNYKTGIKHLYFRMEADQYSARIAIVLNHPDDGIRALMYEQFAQYRDILQEHLGEQWHWAPVEQDAYGKTTASIAMQITNVSIMNPGDWPTLIAFFKPRIIALDHFWSTARYAFDLFK